MITMMSRIVTESEGIVDTLGACGLLESIRDV